MAFNKLDKGELFRDKSLLEFATKAYEKYNIGQEEHKGYLPDRDCLDEILNETIDLWFYALAVRENNTWHTDDPPEGKMSLLTVEYTCKKGSGSIPDYRLGLWTGDLWKADAALSDEEHIEADFPELPFTTKVKAWRALPALATSARHSKS